MLSHSPLFCSHSVNKIQTTILNPLQLTPANSLTLGKVIHQIYLNTNQRYFSKGWTKVMFEDKQSGETVEVDLGLTYALLMRPCHSILSDVDDYHLEVLGGVIGVGAYGCVLKSQGKLVCQTNGSLELRPSERIIKIEMVSEDWSIDDANNEARIGNQMIRLKAPVITDVNEQKYVFMVGDYYDGYDLAMLLSEFRLSACLNVTQRLHILQEILFDVKKMHALGIIHRDIKPANIRIELLDHDRICAHLIDFNLAKWSKDKETVVLESGNAYFAPGAESKVNKRTDTYSLGKVTEEIFGSDPPFAEHSCLANLFKGCHDLSKEHQDVIKECIARFNNLNARPCVSHDYAIEKIDQIKLERMIANENDPTCKVCITQAYHQALALRGVIEEALQYALFSIKAIQFQSLISLLEEVSAEPPRHMTEIMGAYILDMQSLQAHILSVIDNLMDYPAVISIFIDTCRIRHFYGLESKVALTNAVNRVFIDYIQALTRISDTIVRLKAFIFEASSSEGNVEHLGTKMWPLIQALSQIVALCGDYSSNLDDLFILERKLNKAGFKIAQRLEEIEISLNGVTVPITSVQATLFGRSSLPRVTLSHRQSEVSKSPVLG